MINRPRHRVNWLLSSCLMLACSLSSCISPNGVEYSFTYGANKADYEDNLYYSDDYFLSPSTEYNPSLATLSLSFAMASFASGENEAIRTSTRFRNIQGLLSKTGFSDFEANEDFHKPARADTIGIVFAHKTVGGTPLIYVGIRGANYEAEWASNFTISEPDKPYQADGTFQYHYGFRTCADTLISQLKDYLSKRNIQGEAKIWASGYSRAGATANIAAGLLDQAIEKGEKPLGENITLRKENLFAYCFEPPMGAPADADDEGNLLARKEMYSNIFNHVNFNDPIPMVAMKEVGFTRFGQDRYYPDALSYLDYKGHEATMKGLYERLPNYEALGGNYKIPRFTVKVNNGLKLVNDEASSTWTQGLFLKEIISLLTRFGLGVSTYDDIDPAKAKYVETIQPAIRTIFKIIYEASNFKGSFIDLAVAMINDIASVFDIDQLITDILDSEERKYFLEDLTVILRRGLAKFDIEFTWESVKDKLRAFVNLLGDFADEALAVMHYPQLVMTWISKDNITSIASGHYPELCLAHTRALDPNYVASPMKNVNSAGKYFVLTLPLGTDEWTVKTNGRVLASGIGKGFLEKNVPCRSNLTGVQIVLPYGEEYEVETNAGDTALLTLFDYTKQGNDVDYEFAVNGNTIAFR